MERRLSAIFAADMVGYSRLMEADEVGTLERQKTHRAELIDPNFEEFHGRIVKEMGDGILVEFPSIVEAVQCAVIIQREMSVRETDVANDRRIQYRIGINLGDIIIEEDDIFGDGVNVAARLEQIAEPGGICISGTAYDHLKSKVEVGYESLGDVQVKNIKQAVRAYRVLTDPDQVGETIGDKRIKLAITRQFAAIAAVLLVAIIGGSGWWWSQQPDFEPVKPAQMALELPKEPSIAVLPFDYLGADKSNNEYLADGLSENITAYLAQLPNMLVIARNSSFTFKGKAVDVREVSKKFGVRYILEGSIQKTGDKLRITAQLIDAVAGKHLWAETYDRGIDEFFTVQDEITLAIIRNIYAETVVGDLSTRINPTNLAAFIEYQKGFASIKKFTPSDMKQAQQHFETAIDLEPNYPDAIAGLGFVHLMGMRLGFSNEPSKSFKLAIKYLEDALKIQSTHPSATISLSIVRLLEKRGNEAYKLLSQALENSPNDAEVVGSAAFVLRNLGKTKEALPLYKRVRRLQPVQPWWLVYDEYAAYLDAGEYQKALKLTDNLRRVISDRNAPDVTKYGVNMMSSVAYWYTGNKEEAKRLVDEALEQWPQLSMVDVKQFNLPYIDQSIPERKYAVWRELGIPENPPLKLPDKPSIAVLPFTTNMSNNKEQEYFVDGMTEDLITDLSQISGLFVIARNSTFSYKGRDVKVQKVGRELGVRYVVEGSVRRTGGKIRINVQLIDAKTAGHLWAERFDRDFDDIFALQDEVVENIVLALQVRLTTNEKRGLLAQLTNSTKAYDLFLQGRREFVRRSKEGNSNALALFEKATIIDPQFALGFSYSAWAHTRNFIDGWSSNSASSLEQARKLSDKAVALNDALPLSHFVSGLVSLYRKDHEKALAAMANAIALDTNYSDAYAVTTRILNLAGRPETGLRPMETAMRLNPQKPQAYLYILGTAYFGLRRYEDAANIFNKALARNPTAQRPRMWLVATLSILNQIEDAEWEASEILSLNPDFSISQIGRVLPFKNPAHLETLLNGLRKAGLPE